MKSRAYWPLDDAPQLRGDGRFVALNMQQDPSSLPPGFYCLGENVRIEGGVVGPRKGVRILPWANLHNMPTDERIRPYGVIYGFGSFLDPDELSWMLVATNTGIYRTRPNNGAQQMMLPTGLTLQERTQFLQAFDVCMALRDGQRPLYITDVEDSWTQVTQAVMFDDSATYAYGDEVYFGDIHNSGGGNYLDRSVSSLARSDSTVTATTSAAHGFASGQSVSIRGAVETEYNGRHTIIVTSATTFTYEIETTPTTPATGTIYASPDDVVWRCLTPTSAGESPRSASAKWQAMATLDPIPNSGFGLFAQNRVFLVHGRDLVAASDVLDYIHYIAQLQDLRINTGTSDRLLTLVKLSETAVICFKERSVHVVWNVYGDLSSVRLDEVTREFGIAGPRAWCRVGNQVWFLASNGSIRAIYATSEQKILVGRRRVSDPVTPIMDRIAWAHAHNAAAMTYDGRTYWALPIDEAERVDDSIIDYTSYPVRGMVLVPVTVGQLYRWEPGDSEIDLVFAQRRVVTITRSSDTATVTLNAHGFATGDQIVIEGADQAEYNGVKTILVTGANAFTFEVEDEPATPATGTIYAFPFSGYLDGPGDFVAVYDLVTIRGTAYLPATGTLQPVYQGNNVVLVGRAIEKEWVDENPGYEFNNDVWESVDSGRNLHVKEWLTFPYDGKERLFAATLDGFITLWEEDVADLVSQDYYSNPPTLGLETWRQNVEVDWIQSRWRSRAYFADMPGWKRTQDVRLSISTWMPNYTVRIVPEGMSEGKTVLAGRTRDRSRYYKPHGRTPYDPTNAWDDHDEPHREDYSVSLEYGGITLGSGLALDLHQETTEGLRAYATGRHFQVEVLNTKGRLEVQAVELTAIAHGRRLQTQS